MTGSVRIARMRLHRARNGPSDGYAAVRALDLAAAVPDRTVLVIRRLSVPAGDARTARERIAALLRDAARPALGPPAPDCAAVRFSDEVEAMSCLTADLVAGRAADRWYWPAAVRAGTAGIGTAAIGTTLATLWLDRATWVPAMLAHLARRSPPDAVRAVAALSDAQARAVLHTVLAAFRAPAVPATGPSSSQLASLTPGLAEPATELRPAARALLALGLTLAATPSAVRSTHLLREIDSLLHPEGGREEPRTQPPTTRTLTTEPHPHQGRGELRAQPPTARPLTTGLATEHARGTPRQGRGTPRHGWGTPIRSRFATLFYAVNLMTWLDLPRANTPEPESGWATLEAIGRSLLPADPPDGPPDPIWRILAGLDGRSDPPTPAPVRLGALTHRLRGLLDRHRLTPGVFAQPGTLIVGRTHVDVVLGLHQIDLAVRMSGVDQDPGWVPALGRIIAFHFDDGS